MISRFFLFWLLAILAFFLCLYAVQPILLPFIIGMLIAYILDPAADWLETKHLSRNSATLVICCIFFMFFIGGLAWLIPALSGQALTLIDDLPRLIDLVKNWIGPYLESSSNVLDSLLGAQKQTNSVQTVTMAKESADASGLLGATGQLLGKLVKSTSSIIGLFSLLLITPIVSFYLLRDWDRMVERIDSLLPRKHADTIRTQFEKIDQVLSGFIRGTLNVSFILAIFYMIALTVAGLNYALVIGLVGGIAIIIPFLGTLMSGLLAVGMAMSQYESWEEIAIVAAIFAVGQIMEGNFLTPKMVGDRVGLHPVWIIFGMLAGGTLLGFVGVLLAVPITASIGVLARFGIERYRESDYYKAK